MLVGHAEKQVEVGRHEVVLDLVPVFHQEPFHPVHDLFLRGIQFNPPDENLKVLATDHKWRVDQEVSLRWETILLPQCLYWPIQVRLSRAYNGINLCYARFKLSDWLTILNIPSDCLKRNIFLDWLQIPISK